VPARYPFPCTLLLVLALSACAPRATSVLTGAVVWLPTNEPLSDVVVTATSPSLPDERIVMTDRAGQYWIPLLPPGTYALHFDPGVGAGVTRPGIQVRAERTVRINAALAPGTRAEASFPAASTTAGVHVGADFVRNIAVVRPCGRGRECHDLLRPRLDGCLPPTPPGQGSRRPSWSHPYAPLLRPTGEPQLVHCNG
jgi:Carboxypeptidase regulatory-like domain